MDVLNTDLTPHFSQPGIEVLMSLLLGISLSASCGFRVFIPPLVLSVASLFFGVTLPGDLVWFSTYPAFMIFLTATLLEVGAYYVAFLDNALDHVTAPASIVAGTIITHSFIGIEMDPMLKWVIALIAGGGASGAVQSMTSLLRSASSLFSFGLGNSTIATAENTAAFTIPAVSIFFPLLAIFLVSVVLVITLMVFSKKKKTDSVDKPKEKMTQKEQTEEQIEMKPETNND